MKEIVAGVGVDAGSQTRWKALRAKDGVARPGIEGTVIYTCSGESEDKKNLRSQKTTFEGGLDLWGVIQDAPYPSYFKPEQLQKH